MNLLARDNPILHRPALAVLPDELERLARDMWKFMSDPAHPGVGIAAPQIGIEAALFVMDTRSLEMRGWKRTSRVCLTPGWTPAPDAQQILGVEGCLSIPGAYTKVARWTAIDASWVDLDGTLQKKRMHDFEARVFQHEHDHLLGKVIWKSAPVDEAMREIEARITLP